MKTKGKDLSKEYYKLLCFGDRHAVSNNSKIDNIILSIIDDHKKDIKIIVDLGDGLDADCLSTYDKQHDQLTGLQKELNSDYDFRNRIKKLSPASQKILLKCNHFSARFDRIKSREYWTADLEALDQSNLQKLDELGWVLRTEYIWGQNKILFVHGDGGDGISSNKNIINRARDMVIQNNISIVRGHSHTTGYEVHRKFGELYHAIQVGTMYNLSVAPRYIKSGQYLSNWTNSIGMFYCHKNGKQFFYTPIVIDQGQAIFEGKVY